MNEAYIEIEHQINDLVEQAQYVNPWDEEFADIIEELERLRKLQKELIKE